MIEKNDYVQGNEKYGDERKAISRVVIFKGDKHLFLRLIKAETQNLFSEENMEKNSYLSVLLNSSSSLFLSNCFFLASSYLSLHILDSSSYRLLRSG